MRKLCCVILFLIAVFQQAGAGHISGGEMYYSYVGPGSQPNTNLYRVTLRLFRDCNPLPNPNGSNPPDLPGAVTLGVFNNGSNTVFIDSIGVPATSNDVIRLRNPFSCIVNAPEVCYEISYYTTTVQLPVSVNGYTLSFQTCCRINGLSNGSGSQGATYVTNIPGTNTLPNGVNSSPEFLVKDTVLVCRNKRFQLPFTANDPDGDSLSYSFCDAFASIGFTAAQNRKPFAPPYASLNYSGGYSGSAPLGSNISINSTTGIISGIAPSGGFINPNGASYFVVTVCINEWRNGQIISTHRKDFIIRISSCDFADAELPVDNRTCDGFNYTFSNLTSSSQIKTWSWDFGVPGITTDVSSDPSPTYLFPDTGVFKIRLIVNKDSICTDTAYTDVYVFPGFTPAINAYNGCKNVPIQFNDATQTAFGFPNYWAWDFGAPGLADTSRLRNPIYTYLQNGTYFVKLIVGSNKGCIDTASTVVSISDKPPLRLSNDTLICSIDTLQLFAFAQGSFQWTPNYNISSLTVSNPLVSPDVRTKYYVTVTLAPGCVNTDSVIVDVKDFVTLAPPRDTVICRGDAVTLRPQSDGLYYSWSPPALFADPKIKNAIATPTAGSTLFTVVSSIGKCNASASVRVTTIPYPVVNAGPDLAICTKDTVLLTGSGNASRWLWSPARFTATPASLSTLAYPASTTQFVLQGTDTLGCPKPSFDTMLIRVVPPVRAFAGDDTSVVVGQPLQLSASGGSFYEWSPPTYLNSVDVGNPVAKFDTRVERFRYFLKATTPEGCFGFDTINIRIFKTAPDIFVPTGFTPNDDDLNDFLIPIPVGISKFDYFRVFNRWGNEVFATTQTKQGWDGNLKGIPQAADTYVWMVSGTDFTGKKVVKKGTVVLIR
jgi:gliding motility-associated-like protein